MQTERKRRPGLILGLVVVVVAFALGTYFGFHTSTIPVDGRNIVHKAILKITYGIDRLGSIYNTPDSFKARWREKLAEIEDKTIGVYTGHGTDATPFLPIQLEQAGFEIKRIGNDNISDLDECSVFVVPGGHYDPFDLNEEDWTTLSDFVDGGGGYVGICLGVVFSKKIGLIESELIDFPMEGLIKAEVPDNEITSGTYKLPSRFFHMNGKLLNNAVEAGEVKPLVQSGDNIIGGYGEYGKGRFVLFSSHPEGGKFEYDNFVLVEGHSLRTMDMLLDAILYVMPTD